jgi:hypothetical protein
MNDTLWGVLAGGLITSIAPLLTLIYGERRWKAEALMSQLRGERDKIEATYERALQHLGEGSAENSYSISMIADFLVLMPKDISDLFVEHMLDTSKTADKTKERSLEIASAMRRDLNSRDQTILDLTR